MRQTKLLLLLFAVIFLASFTLSSAMAEINPNPAKQKYVAKTAVATPYWMKNVVMCSGQKFASNTVLAPMLWSSVSTWTSIGTTKPVAGSAVTIPTGIHIILDETPPALANVTINGVLEFARTNLNLTADWIMVMGKLEIGTPTAPFIQKAIITLKGSNTNESVMGMGTRGIMVMGGTLELHGTPPSKIWTKLNNHAAANTTNLSLADPVAWTANDQVAIGITDFYGVANGSVQQTTISSVNNSTSINLQNGLNAQRWGKLQYVTTTGMSLTPGTLPANIDRGTPTILDERAEVANLTRNIVIQSPDDALWQNNSFGCHVMIMRNGNTQGVAHLNGVEIKRGGQAGKLGRYPFHWHMLSYDGSTTLPDITGQYIRNSVINKSSQRGIVIHGTNGAEVKNNIVYDVRGHGIFTEDAVERRNIIDGNLVFKVRNSAVNEALKLHETETSFGASGFWISNPDNVIVNNIAADCAGMGFWLAFPTRIFGASAAVALNPSVLKFGIFNNNHAHGNQNTGIFIDNPEIDEAGNTEGYRYTSTTNMQNPQWPYAEVLTYELSEYSTWKNNRSGVWNRSNSPRNIKAISADNTGKFFSGASDNIMTGAIEKTLAVGTSLNYNMNGVLFPDTYGSDEPPVAFASYHSTFEIKNNVIVNFPAVLGKSSGAFALDDYYLIPVDKGSVRNPNNIIINSHPGVRILPREPQFTFGVVWDYHNYWGGPAAQDNYYVFDNPFFTYGLPTHLPQNNTSSGGVVVPGPFYGFHSYTINGVVRTYDKISVSRTTAAGATVGNWTVEGGFYGDLLGNMRHFATHPSGYYYLDFPTLSDVNDFQVAISNMTTTNDYQVVSIEYSGDYLISNLFSSTAYNMSEFGNAIPFPVGQQDTHSYAAVGSFQAVVNAPFGEVYWQDRINNKVWFKVRGGINDGYSDLAPNNDANLYKEFAVRAYGVQSVLSNVQAANDLETKIQLYPNPSTGVVTVSNCENSKFKLFDMLGRFIKQGTIVNSTLDISECNSGNYVLQIEVDSKIETKKIIKI